MIIDILFTIGVGILNNILDLFTWGNYLLPDALTDSITWFFGYGNYFKGVFPVETLYLALTSYLTVISGYYLLRLILGLVGMIPFFGNNINVNILEDIKIFKKGSVRNSVEQ